MARRKSGGAKPRGSSGNGTGFHNGPGSSKARNGNGKGKNLPPKKIGKRPLKEFAKADPLKKAKKSKKPKKK
jgi:hypothetical protein